MSAVRTMLAATVAIVAIGCGGGDRDEADSTLLVLAAASLADAFAEIAAEYEIAAAGRSIELSVGGSSSLVVQIEEGAPADVIATADLATMERLGALVDDVEVFAMNEVVIATPTDDPAGIARVDDLERPDVLVGVCAEQVPCGRYATQLFTILGVAPSIVTEEPDVRSLATKLIEGELDAGVVYATDVRSSSGMLRTIDLPADPMVDVTYPIAVVTETSDRRAADDFVAFVRSPAAQAVLREAGFEVPS